MVDLTMKDNLLRILVLHVDFGAPFVDDHYDLIGPLSLLYVDVCRDCENVNGMGGICRVNDYGVSGYMFQMVICYFLPKNAYKILSYFFSC